MRWVLVLLLSVPGCIELAPPCESTAEGYADLDGDGWGAGEVREWCAEAPWLVSRTGDCDDGDQSTHPGAEETWYDGIDQDCLGDSDYDADGDGWDSAAHGGTDCDDTDPDVGPPEEDDEDGCEEEEDTGEEDTGEEDTGEEDTGEEDTGEEDTGESDDTTDDGDREEEGSGDED